MKPSAGRSRRWLLSLTLMACLAFDPGLIGAPATPEKSEIPSDVKAQLRSALEAEHNGNLREARQAYERAISLARARLDIAAEARVLRHRGITALHQRDFSGAAFDLTESVRLYEEAGDPVGAAISRLDLIPALDATDQRARADAELRAAETTLLASGDEDAQNYAGLVQARRLIDRKEFRAALPRIETAEDYYRRVDKPRRLADALSLKAYVLQHLEQWQPSKEAYVALLDLAFRQGNQGQIAYTYCNLGEVERQLGSPEIASEMLDRSIDLLDRLRANIPGAPEERLTFLDAQVDAYHRKIALLVDTKQTDEAFDLAERFHARAFLESLDVPAQGERSLARDELSNARKLADLQRKLLGAELSADERGALRAAEDRWERFERDTRRTQESVAVAAEDRVALDELRKRIPPDTALLAYWVHPRGTFLWIVRARSVQMIQIPVAATALEDWARRYLTPIRDRTVAEDVALRGGAAEHLAAGAELHRLLVAPAVPHLGGVDRIVVVPDAFLWYLPFEALVTEVGATEVPRPENAPFFWEYSKAKYLGESYRVVYAPSGTAWARLASAGKGGRGFFSLAPASDAPAPADRPAPSFPPLPASKAESAALAALFPSARALVGTEASEARFRESATSARFVHFAAHGYLHRAQPDLSGLILAPGDAAIGATAPGGDDGLLQAHEIKRLRYRSELVSLAACNSALGQFSRGEGLLGIGRAFLTSGARNVLVSLWRVNDATGALLMRHFYSEVARGRNLSAALQSAKRSVRGEVGRGTVVLGNEEISYAHPYFWAGFVEIGADGAAP